MQKKLHIKTGDLVFVIAGKDKGKEGKVLRIDRKSDRVIVENCNMVHKTIKPTAEQPQGGIQKQENYIHISNLMLKDPKLSVPTRIAIKKDDSGKRVRVSKKSGEIIL
jgi:large subunit ribosomal protein L24